MLNRHRPFSALWGAAAVALAAPSR